MTPEEACAIVDDNPASNSTWAEAARTLRQALAEAERKRDAARDALRPFADAAADLDDETHDRSEIWEMPCAMSITAGDLRVAAALVN